jgi:hypothetical protein
MSPSHCNAWRSEHPRHSGGPNGVGAEKVVRRVPHHAQIRRAQNPLPESTFALPHAGQHPEIMKSRG